MMKVNVGHLRKEPGGSEPFDFTWEDPSISEEFRLTGAARVRGEIVNTGTVLQADVHVSANGRAVCSRCLDEVDVPLDFSYQEEFCHESDLANLSEGADEVTLFTGDWLDLTESIRENIIMQVPMQILCADDCPGLCPECGRNRKAGTCDCQVKEVDPRLAALAKLKQS